MCGVEGAALARIDRGELPRETLRDLLVKTLCGAMRAIGEPGPAYPAPVPARRGA